MNTLLAILPDLERILTAFVALVAAVVSVKNGHKMNEFKVSIDGRMEQLLKQTSLASEAKGAADERANPLVPKN